MNTVEIGKGTEKPTSIDLWCDVAPSGLGLTAKDCDIPSNIPSRTFPHVLVGLDRQSFLDRGWTNDDLGAWNNGSDSSRQGLFLSMFYALQNKNDAEPDHPWNEDVHDWDRGLAAHIDYWYKARHNQRFYIRVYDDIDDYPELEPVEGWATIIRGRNSTEEPFKGQEVIGIHNSTTVNGKVILPTDISLRMDYEGGWALGHGMHEPLFIKGTDGKFRLNISYTIAHEMGHFFGFNHICSSDSIMHAGGGTFPASHKPRWQTPDVSNKLIIDLVDQLRL